MTRTAYPAADDISAYLVNSGYSVGSIDLASIAAAAATEWERRSGWTPFLQDPAGDSTNYYFMPRPRRIPERGPRLILPSGFVSLTSVSAGIIYDDTGTPSAGCLLTPNYHYWAEHWLEDQPGTPIVQLRFTRYDWLYGAEFSWVQVSPAPNMCIVGTKGYSAIIPDDVWLGMVEGGALRALVSVLAAKQQNISQVSIAGRVIKYSEAPAFAALGEYINQAIVDVYERP